MIFKVKKFLISVFLLMSCFCGVGQYVHAMEVATAPSVPASYNDYVAAPEPIVLGEHDTHYFPPEEINQAVQSFLAGGGIDAGLFAQDKSVICPKFNENQFDVKKCSGDFDFSVIAFFPTTLDTPAELERFVFKTPFDGTGQDNFKRVFYAQAINDRLQSIGVTSIMRAPQKYLFLVPKGVSGVYTDANYKVISEKIKISKNRGNVFDLMTPAQLKILLNDVVLHFGLCDLHIESLPKDQNIVYDDHGIMIFIDTESLGDNLSARKMTNGFDDNYFRKDKQVLPEEFFIAQKLLDQPKGSDDYKLGRTLARWIHILNMGLITPYKYYNFDTNFPAPQGDTFLNNPGRIFDFASFEGHRRVVREGTYTVMKHIISCTQEIEAKFPDIRKESLDSLLPIGLHDFGLDWGGERRYFDDDTRFAVVPIKEYLTRATQRNEGLKLVIRYNQDGSERQEQEDLSALPGLVFSDLEREFLVLRPALLVPFPSTEKKLRGSFSQKLPKKRPMAPGVSSTFSAMKPPKSRAKIRPELRPALGPSDVRPTHSSKLSNLQNALKLLRDKLTALNRTLT